MLVHPICAIDKRMSAVADQCKQQQQDKTIGEPKR
jgi:hypothetical protein